MPIPMRHACLAVLLAAGLALHTTVALAGPAGLCLDAIQAAEIRYGLPPGLLAAMGGVESGRADAATGRLEPWPWTVQADGQSWYFDSRQQAVQWVTGATARGVTSIDIGCLQVNLFYHPGAFASLDDGFDADRNVDYAARFLLQLHAMTGDWRQATGFYHSQTTALAAAYALRVERQFDAAAAPWPRQSPQSAELMRLAAAWQATTVPDKPASSAGEDNWGMLLHQPRDPAGSRRLAVNTK